MQYLRHPRTLISLSVPALVSTMATSATSSNPPALSYPSYPYKPRHSCFPYTAKDFRRQDESSDADFYSSPRFVTHIDDNAISLLQQYYAQYLPKRGRILDFCSSWISHFPKELEELAVKTAKGQIGGDEKLEVVGMGMNQKELAANVILKDRILQDLNTQPEIPPNVGEVDAATCVVSIDYLIHPKEVLESLRSRMRPGGYVHLVISNRCFPSKAVGKWLTLREPERLSMVGDYLWWSGWRDIEIVTLCDGKGQARGWFSLGKPDPLWVVKGRKVEEQEDVKVRQE